MAIYLTLANQNATRNQPIAENLHNILTEAAQNTGLRVEVFSGGQPAKGPGRVGSHRHDHGNAADIRLYDGDRKLSAGNPEDQKRIAEFVQLSASLGATGIGAGPGYMDGDLHVGFGKTAVWGKGGKGANAPGWLRSAYEAGRRGERPQPSYRAPTVTMDELGLDDGSDGTIEAAGLGVDTGELIAQSPTRQGRAATDEEIGTLLETRRRLQSQLELHKAGGNKQGAQIYASALTEFDSEHAVELQGMAEREKRTEQQQRLMTLGADLLPDARVQRGLEVLQTRSLPDDDFELLAGIVKGADKGEFSRVGTLQERSKIESRITDMRKTVAPLQKRLADVEELKRVVEMESGVANIAAVNAYQRLIDPGAVVREGDVSLIASAESLTGRLTAIVRQFEGKKFTPEIRSAMKAVAEEIAGVARQQMESIERERLGNAAFEAEQLNIDPLTVPELNRFISSQQAAPSSGFGTISMDQLTSGQQPAPVSSGIVELPDGTLATGDGQVVVSRTVADLDGVRRDIYDNEYPPGTTVRYTLPDGTVREVTVDEQIIADAKTFAQSQRTTPADEVSEPKVAAAEFSHQNHQD